MLDGKIFPLKFCPSAGKIWHSIRLTLFIVIAGLLLPALKAADAIPEYDLKATFLFNFARFVEWPENARPPGSDPLIIGIVGDDPFGGALDSIVKGEVVNGRSIVIRHFARKDEITKCHILYICKSESFYLREILNRLKGQPVLTVSDADRFAYSGGTIGLVMDQGKVRIQINIDRAKTAQLAISAKLLRPAVIIRDEPQSMLVPALEFKRYASASFPLMRIDRLESI